MRVKEIREATNKIISTNLRKYRAVLNITQRQLAYRTNLEQSIIARIESGQRKMLAEELPIFADALKVSVNELLS